MRDPIVAEVWSDDYLTEHAYLVERGVRPMALVGCAPSTALAMSEAATRLEVISAGMAVVPFVVKRPGGLADCGFAAARWVVDLFQWISQSPAVPSEHAHRISGLLLGYSADAIRAHDERVCGRRFGGRRE